MAFVTVTERIEIILSFRDRAALKELIKGKAKIRIPWQAILEVEVEVEAEEEARIVKAK